MLAHPNKEDSFMSTFQLIAIGALVVVHVGFFVWKKMAGG
jgi:hypothetical protein